MTDTNPNYFPLPFDGTAVHAESWEKGKAFEGKKVKIIDRDGRTVSGRVHRAETSCDRSRRFYGVGFMLTSGEGRSAQNIPVGADFKSITLVREPDIIRV